MPTNNLQCLLLGNVAPAIVAAAAYDHPMRAKPAW